MPMDPTRLRLGFLTARAGFVEGGAVWTDAGLGRLIDALGARVGRLTVALSPLAERHPLHDHRLQVPAERVLPFPRLPSLARGFFQFRECRAVIRRLEAECDAVVVQLPFAAPVALLRPGTPRVYHLCADILGQATTAPGYRGWRRLPAVAVGWTIDRLQRSLIRRRDARLVSHGAALLDRYGREQGRAVVSSTLLRQEVDSVPRQRPPEAPFRVLFVGYLRHEKGIDVLLEAFERLLEALPVAELWVVGAREGEEGSTLPPREEALLQDLLSRQRLRLLPPQPFGPALFQCYADADVLALTSRNEGTPRVLVEARAFRCPVVASAVGGVPTSVEDGVDGLLVPPGDAEALAAALLRLATEPPLRQRLVTAGLERARRTTVERQAAAILEEVDRLPLGEHAMNGTTIGEE